MWGRGTRLSPFSETNTVEFQAELMHLWKLPVTVGVRHIINSSLWFNFHAQHDLKFGSVGIKIQNFPRVEETHKEVLRFVRLGLWIEPLSAEKEQIKIKYD